MPPLAPMLVRRLPTCLPFPYAMKAPKTAWLPCTRFPKSTAFFQNPTSPHLNPSFFYAPGQMFPHGFPCSCRFLYRCADPLHASQLPCFLSAPMRAKPPWATDSHTSKSPRSTSAPMLHVAPMRAKSPWTTNPHASKSPHSEFPHTQKIPIGRHSPVIRLGEPPPAIAGGGRCVRPADRRAGRSVSGQAMAWPVGVPPIGGTAYGACHGRHGERCSLWAARCMVGLSADGVWAARGTVPPERYLLNDTS